MEFAKWTAACSVNQVDMDAEHRVFLDTLNTLYNDLPNPSKTATFERTIQDLEDYAKKHFAHEEAMLVALDYPHIDQQQAQHLFFRNELVKLKASVATATAYELQSVLQFMRDWFLNHILTLDKKYAKWFEELNIEVF